MKPKLLDSILTVRYGLKKSGKCCADYKLHEDVLKNISNSNYYPTKAIGETDRQLEDTTNLMDLDQPIIF
jgi:hypothetical protein